MSHPIVTVKQGKLKGAIVKNVLGGKYIAFRGIPYAVPPVGNLRFKVLLIYLLYYQTTILFEKLRNLSFENDF